jgi:hypothetical protein
MSKIKKLFSLLLLLGGLGVMFFGSQNPVILAQSSGQTTKSDPCTQNKIDYSNLFILSKNIPVVPKGCGVDKDGQAVPLSPAYIGDIALRIYSFFISLVFNLLALGGVIMGLQILIKNYTSEGDATSGVTEFFKKKLPTMLWGLVLVLFAYIVPITIFSIFGISVVKDFECIFETPGNTRCGDAILKDPNAQKEVLNPNNNTTTNQNSNNSTTNSNDSTNP